MPRNENPGRISAEVLRMTVHPGEGLGDVFDLRRMAISGKPHQAEAGNRDRDASARQAVAESVILAPVADAPIPSVEEQYDRRVAHSAGQVEIESMRVVV